MLILPAIDLLNGSCVRLYKGEYSQSTQYSDDPVAVAKTFAEAGAKVIHVVDLDAAKGGRNNRDIIKRITLETGCDVETGGGIRTAQDIEELLEAGVKQLILGTIFTKEPETVRAWIKNYGGDCFIAGIDAMDGYVKVAGWEKNSGIRDEDLAKKAAEFGFSSIIFTNIAKDGTLEGPDLENTIRIANISGLPVILSGGISCDDDIKKTVNAGCPGIKGIITGKAVYENKINLSEVIRKYQIK